MQGVTNMSNLQPPNFNEDNLKYNIGSVEKLFIILEHIREQRTSVSISDVATAVGESRSTVHRFFKTIENMGYLLQNPETKKYYLTPKFLSFSYSVLSRDSFITDVTPLMMLYAKQYTTTVVLYMIDDLNVYNAYIIPPDLSRLSYPPIVGKKVRAYASSVGKLAFAYASNEQLDDYIEKTTLTPITANTIINKDELRAEIAKVRKQGYAISNAELIDINWSVSLPIFNSSGDIYAGISIIYRTDQIRDINIPDIVAEVKKELHL